MKVLLVSNRYPSAEYPFGSIYVKNHYERLKREKVIDIVDKHVIYRKDTSLIGTIIKYCRCYVLFTKKLFNKYDVLHLHFMSPRSEEHTSELQSRGHLVCRLLLEKKKKKNTKSNQP